MVQDRGATVTLIGTAISNLGIVMASDSNLTSATGEYAGEAQKVFRVDRVAGVLAVAGTYSVGGRLIDDWMPDAISTYCATTAPTMRGFAEFLRDQLAEDIEPAEHASGTLIHLAGYVEEGSEAHPEFWFVRNFTNIDPSSGAYVGRGSFQISEDFWTRDYMNPGVQDALEAGTEQRYFNGYPAGRIAYLGFMLRLGHFLRQTWADPAWKFRAPRSVDELARFVDLEIRAIGAMFFSSDYAAPYIGGTVQIETIRAPHNAIKLGSGAPRARYGGAR